MRRRRRRRKEGREWGREGGRRHEEELDEVQKEDVDEKRNVMHGKPSSC